MEVITILVTQFLVSLEVFIGAFFDFEAEFAERVWSIEGEAVFIVRLAFVNRVSLFLLLMEASKFSSFRLVLLLALQLLLRLILS